MKDRAVCCFVMVSLKMIKIVLEMDRRIFGKKDEESNFIYCALQEDSWRCKNVQEKNVGVKRYFIQFLM